MIGKNLTLKDAIKSATAKASCIDNTPNEEQLAAMELVAVNIYDLVKEEFPDAFVNSFFRSELLNKKIGGASNSQHCKGEAIDIDSKDDNTAIFNWIKANLTFDQLIWEKGNSTSPAWVHVSYKKKGNRQQVLKIV